MPLLARAVREWLRAEAAGRGEDQALTRVLRAHPTPAPSVDFAARVLQRAAWELGWVRRDLFTHRGLRAAVGAALGLAGGSLAFLRGVLRPLVELAAPGDLINAVAEALSAGARWVAEGLRLWQLVALVSDALATAAARPQVAASLLASALLAVVAFRALNTLITSERSR